MNNWLDILKRFQTGTLHRDEWTHKARLVIGLWYLLEYREPEAALVRLRDGIMAFNISIGDQNTDTDGYHHTITRFWVYELYGFVQRAEERSFDELAVAIQHDQRLLASDRILEIYPRAVLFTPLARRQYVPPPAPDLAAHDTSSHASP